MRYTLSQLIDQYDAGERLKFLFFWGHRTEPGPVTQSCLSQWYPSPFTVRGIRYATAEHWMMAEKARLFKDEAMAAQIVATDNPGEAKKLGRQIQGFDGAVWDAAKMDIVVTGSIHKFSSSPELMGFLLGTAQRVLVEASPVDTIWGIGKKKGAQGIENPHSWRGENLLGFALMEARDQLMEGLNMEA